MGMSFLPLTYFDYKKLVDEKRLIIIQRITYLLLVFLK